MKPNDQGWNNPKSFINIEASDDAALTATGRYFYAGTEFKFSLRQQTNGKYFLRGRISVISPEDGKTIQLSGEKKRKKLDTLRRVGKLTETASDIAQNRMEKLNITVELNLQSAEIECIQNAVARKAEELYSEHAPLIMKRQKGVSTPEKITPVIAAALYAEDYLQINKKGCSENTLKAYKKSILNFYVALHDTPMSQFSPTQMKKILRDASVGRTKLKLLSDFWQYCVDKPICHGKNPFPATEKRKQSPETLLKKATRPDELDSKIQAALYVYAVTHAEKDSTICALALKLWAGFSDKDICAMTWADVLFDFNDPDKVRINYHQDNKARATHNYTRPIMPQAARVLNLRYERLCKEIDPENLLSYPIVSMKKSPRKAMPSAMIAQNCGIILRSVGVKEATFAILKGANGEKIPAVSSRLLLNTYKKNIVLYSGLGDDQGRSSFLMGNSLKHLVTDDHYTSYTDTEAVECFYQILSRLQPDLPTDGPEFTKTSNEHYDTMEFKPSRTSKAVGIVGDITLQPGEEVEILCPHGAIGSLVARAITPNGLKRKSGPRKHRTEKKSAIPQAPPEKQLEFEQLRMDEIEDREEEGEASST